MWSEFNDQDECLDCDINNVTDSVRDFCLNHQWPLAALSLRQKISKNKINFVSYFNDTYTIDMICIGNKHDGLYPTEDDERYDLDAKLIVIHNHKNNYFLILGNDGRAFLESTDFSCGWSRWDGPNLEFVVGFDSILDMASVFL